MDTKTILLYAIVALVMIGIPVLLGKLTGTSPMEILFGERTKKTLFGSRKNEKGNSSGNAADKDSESGPGRENTQKGTGGRSLAAQKNSSQQELMKTISDLLSYGRRNRFYCIIPGTIMNGDEVASLAVLMVTRNSVLGFNCFGYGGTVYAGTGTEDWRQELNGEERKIPSPVIKNARQKEIIDAVLDECGYGDIRSEIFGIFTASGAVLKDGRKTRCYTKDAMMATLKENRFMEDKGVDPKTVGKALEPYRKKAKPDKSS